ncbi:CBO0543 family protein [Mesobacillus foraminis]|uniref:CBO0543 family protein n=1 Tax=Mesobacillus foraminis TaxID=279826 RepID=UPI00214C0259|nr:CBO0543 family protein [Mesobacillus foraminis]
MIAMWLLGSAGFTLFIPRKDWRKGIIAFLMFQAIIWLGDMITFKFDWQHSPVRLFPKATDMPLTLDYFFYPVLFALFYGTKKLRGSLRSRFIYFFVWISVLTLFDSVIERYTDLLEYETATWYLIMLEFGLLYYVSEVCCNWFFKDKALFQTERRWETNEN